jgi:hypothetical protein
MHFGRNIAQNKVCSMVCISALQEKAKMKKVVLKFRSINSIVILSLSLHFFELVIFLKKVKIFPSERHSFLNLSAPVLNFSGDEGKIFTFKPAQKSAGSAIKLLLYSILKKAPLKNWMHHSR